MQLKDPGQSIPLYEQMMQRYQGKAITDSRSPTGNWLGCTLLEASRGKVRLSVRIRHEMTNPYGNIHGGMMSTFIDESIGWAVVSLDSDYHYTSLNLNVDFLYAAKEGETMIASAQVVREGKKIVHVECAIHNSEGILLAKASSNLINTSMQLKA